MYKIYIGTVPLQLLSTADAAACRTGNFRDMVLRHTPRKRKTLHQIIDGLEKGTQSYDSVTVFHDDLTVLKEDFFSLYEVRCAGGGVVQNQQNDILAIYRLGYWDLPKGKQEKGESIQQTALREVQEETGIQQLTLGNYLCETYHTHRSRKGKRILKHSTWFKMQSNDTHLVPQTEEDIERVEWLSKAEFLQKEPTYNNIIDVLNHL